MVVDRDVEALAMVGSDGGGRMTTGCVGGKGRDKKGGTPQVGGSTTQYSTAVYRSRLQSRSGCEWRPVEARRQDVEEGCCDLGVQQMMDMVCLVQQGEFIGCPRYATLVRRGGRRAQYQILGGDVRGREAGGVVPRCRCGCGCGCECWLQASRGHQQETREGWRGKRQETRRRRRRARRRMRLWGWAEPRGVSRKQTK